MAFPPSCNAFVAVGASTQWLPCSDFRDTRNVQRHTGVSDVLNARRRNIARMVLHQPGQSLRDYSPLLLPSATGGNVRDLWRGDGLTHEVERHMAYNYMNAHLDADDENYNDDSDLENLPVVGDEKDSRRKIQMPWDTTGVANAQGISYLGKRVVFLRRRSRILQKSYAECERITSLFAKTFYLGTSFLPKNKRKAVWAIYTWCRRTDDLVDGPRVKQRTEPLIAVLADWEKRLEDMFIHARAKDALDLALVDVTMNFSNMSITPFRDMIKGMVMDVNQDRFETFQDLYLYCYRVAGTVGLMTLPILDTVKGGRAGLRDAAESALALGIALQLTNILRDVGEDRLRGRIYLPLEDLRRFNYTEEDLFNCVLDSRYKKLMKFQIARARRYFKAAEQGVAKLSEDSRLPVRASLDMYSQILDVLEENDYDNFHRRAYVPKPRKAATVPLSYLRIQQAGVGAFFNRVIEKLSPKKREVDII